jgi:hypothetical protein
MVRESAELRAFVVTYGRLLPLEKPSPLGDKVVIQKLMALSSGLTGKLTSILAQAAELAIRQKTESITLDLIEQAGNFGIYKYPLASLRLNTCKTSKLCDGRRARAVSVRVAFDKSASVGIILMKFVI